MFQAERGWNWCQWRGNQITIWWKLGEFWNNNSLEINDPLREAEQIPNASSSTAQVQIASLCQSSGTATRVTSPWTLFTPAATSEVKCLWNSTVETFEKKGKSFYRRQIFQEATKIFVSPKKILNLGWVEIKLLNEFSSSNMGGHKLPTVCGCLFGRIADTHMAMQTLTYREPGIQRRPGIERRLT